VAQVNLRIDDAELARIDVLAAEAGLLRSAYIRARALGVDSVSEAAAVYTDPVAPVPARSHAPRPGVRFAVICGTCQQREFGAVARRLVGGRCDCGGALAVQVNRPYFGQATT
jgi:hypothetical protein